MTRFALTVEFDGRPYMGWQRQAHGPSVQQHIEEALGRIVGAPPVVHCAGRTDAGVHALAMRAHVDLDSAITPFRLMEALNAHLRPEPIAIIGCEAVADDWHARFSCLARSYDYRILNRRAPLTFEQGLIWRVPQRLDSDRMHEAAQQLVGRHDFTTFRSAQCQADSPVRTLDRLDVIRTGERISVLARARSFLHHQVRSMVGCLVMVGAGSWSVSDLKAALDARDRAALGHNAPPDGLYFVAAFYPGEPSR
ncbi:tRNA pseudouridine(38-40) synthase TruA [Sphingobium lignivorans]|uniref:tRNA pseudouridine synthase A n=1 Tax=Sphingobium lignivorans TaxID=2735886 RepID=A0ABR6NH83_9SPHN|nr:tRNA pseudouridine(38-40) synthase TruA [Sphingobium lignivorans]MBB5986451.1 tRNA pseudouridine38-40 synthase [Sphingobium lignivorans]